MGRIVVVAFLILMSLVSYAADRNQAFDEKYFQYTDSVEEVQTPPEVIALIAEQNKQNELRAQEGEPAAPASPLDAIVNLAMQVWAIIVENKPALNVSTSYANALPMGVESAAALENFSQIHYKSFRRHGQNCVGTKVYDVTYTVLHRYGGSYEGKGQYLDSVAVIPSKVDVAWGYAVNFNVNNTSVVNLGTKEAPVASVGMDMSFDVSSLFSKDVYRTVYEFRGDSAEFRVLE